MSLALFCSSFLWLFPVEVQLVLELSPWESQHGTTFLFGYRERSSGRPDAIELVTLNHRIQILGNILRVQKIIAKLLLRVWQTLFVNLEMFLKSNSSSKSLCNLTSMAPEFHCCFFDVQTGGVFFWNGECFDYFGTDNAIFHVWHSCYSCFWNGECYLVYPNSFPTLNWGVACGLCTFIGCGVHILWTNVPS